MSKIIGRYEFEDVSESFKKDYAYGWLHLLPTIEYRHKYWYLWELEFHFWKWEKRFEISRTDWKNRQDIDKKWFWNKIRK